MTIYAESSAVLAWLLSEPDGARVREALIRADIVAASDLTLLEVERVLVRAVTLDEMTEAAATDRRAVLTAAAVRWHQLRLTAEIFDRARRPFPAEPIRSLDALHLASALAARSTLPGLELLSLDQRIRRSGALLGFRLQPA
ncbi:MAG: PIN domain-containing protein [Terriglobales bacterium]